MNYLHSIKKCPMLVQLLLSKFRSQASPVALAPGELGALTQPRSPTHETYEVETLLGALVAMAFLAAFPAQGQETKTLNSIRDLVTPVQAEDLVSVRVTLDDQPNPSALRNSRIATFWDTADDMLGANLHPVGDALRAQIDIPSGQGLVVEGLRGDGACAQAGLQQNDILLSLADKPLGTVGDLIKQLKAAGDSPVPLHILRAGKPVTIQVRPIYRVTLGPVGEQKTENYIGISVIGPNDYMRAQLGLTDGKGMVVNQVEKGSPAEKAGVKKYDIVLELNGKPIDSPESLKRQVQAAQEYVSALKILRAGKPMTINVLPATRKVEVSPNPEAGYRTLLLNTAEVDMARLALGTTIQSGPVVVADQFLRQSLVQNGQSVDANELRRRLDHLEKELTAVHAALDKINETLKDKKGGNK